jgi:hypothetical protein
VLLDHEVVLVGGADAGVGEVGDGSGEAVLKSQAAFVVNPGTDVMTLKYFCRKIWAKTMRLLLKLHISSFLQKMDFNIVFLRKKLIFSGNLAKIAKMYNITWTPSWNPFS